MNDFPIEPSPEFVRLKGEQTTLLAQWREAADIETLRSLHDPINRVNAALRATPEQQYLDEIQTAEHRAWELTLADELQQLGRMTSVLMLDPQPGVDMDEAIEDGHLSSVADPIQTKWALTVLADMRRLSSAQVAAALRMMADSIEEDGIVVYRGPYPERLLNDDRTDWWVTERPDGSLRHDR